jgi:fluoride ion exporter CrcB/FEX
MNVIAPGYEYFFDWGTYQDLLNAVFNNLDYSKMGWSILVVNLIALAIFYKFWDPVSASKLKWWLSILGIGIVSYISTSTILYNNIEIIQHIATGLLPDGDYFITQMSMISFGYSVIIAFFLSIVPFRLISTNNRNNPF